MSQQQLSLGVSLRDEATFDNFFIAAQSNNAATVAALKQQLQPNGEAFIFCWGAPGSGLTHLLQASCHTASELGLTSQYLPLSDLVGYQPDSLLEGIEAQHLICLDDLQCVVGYPDWEQTLFNLLNRIRDNGGRLLMSADASPLQLAVDRDDLRSRFAWGATFHVESLEDEGKKSALKLRAKERGMDLNDEVANYILNRAPRDMTDLFDILNLLDELSLAAQRRLTIPFVKQVLERG